ncbi:hypothetical protein GDO81_022739 [Engystomops pustulosus]|uniref:Uncharacterized protein n=1 Tax=Engystomops pustulosus TaxID=76066 RepID=A0AAV6YP16_ENGPU|nr:hypothetical protein GDO81_022739 [Engystomops pustulosus]
MAREIRYSSLSLIISCQHHPAGDLPGCRTALRFPRTKHRDNSVLRPQPPATPVPRAPAVSRPHRKGLGPGGGCCKWRHEQDIYFCALLRH